MRNLLALLGAAVVAFVAVGWLRGWYQVKTAVGPEGHRQVNIDINGPKINQDLSTGRERLRNILESPPRQAPAPGEEVSAFPPAGENVTVRPGPQGENGGRFWFVPRN
jgi:hypothetical protein